MGSIRCSGSSAPRPCPRQNPTSKQNKHHNNESKCPKSRTPSHEMGLNRQRLPLRLGESLLIRSVLFVSMRRIGQPVWFKMRKVFAARNAQFQFFLLAFRLEIVVQALA